MFFFEVLKKLQSQGKIKHLGVSNFGVTQIEEVLATGATIACNQIAYNLLSRMPEFEIIPLCKKHNIGVLAYSPLLQGILTGRWTNADDVNFIFFHLI